MAARQRNLTAEAADRLIPEVIQRLFVGADRTAAQDVGFGLRQLTDVAKKALSPGINDPMTAVHALPAVRPGRVLLDRPDFAHFLDLGISQLERTRTAIGQQGFDASERSSLAEADRQVEVKLSRP